jgi:hypothetical protein
VAGTEMTAEKGSLIASNPSPGFGGFTFSAAGAVGKNEGKESKANTGCGTCTFGLVPLDQLKPATGTAAAVAAVSSGGYPPMSLSAPTPFGKTIAVADCSVKSSSAGAYPPMSTSAPTPFGNIHAIKPSSTKAPSSGEFPPRYTSAPTSFGKQSISTSSHQPASQSLGSTRIKNPFAGVNFAATPKHIKSKADDMSKVKAVVDETNRDKETTESNPTMSVNNVEQQLNVSELVKVFDQNSLNVKYFSGGVIDVDILASKHRSSTEDSFTKSNNQFTAKSNAGNVSQFIKSSVETTIQFENISCNVVANESTPRAHNILKTHVAIDKIDCVSTSLTDTKRNEISTVDSNDKKEESESGRVSPWMETINKAFNPVLGENSSSRSLPPPVITEAAASRVLEENTSSNDNQVDQPFLISIDANLITSNELNDIKGVVQSKCKAKDRMDQKLKASQAYSIIMANSDSGVVTKDDFEKLIKAMGTTYNEEEHRQTLKKLSASDETICEEKFTDWYVAWLFGNQSLSESREVGQEIVLDAAKLARRESFASNDELNITDIHIDDGYEGREINLTMDEGLNGIHLDLSDVKSLQACDRADDTLEFSSLYLDDNALHGENDDNIQDDDDAEESAVATLPTLNTMEALSLADLAKHVDSDYESNGRSQSQGQNKNSNHQVDHESNLLGSHSDASTISSEHMIDHDESIESKQAATLMTLEKVWMNICKIDCSSIYYR